MTHTTTRATARDRQQDAPANPRDPSQPATPSPPLRVLVVDDEPLMRWSVSETLGPRGFDVVEADDGHSALLALLDEVQVTDAVLLDLWLPDSSDLRLLAAIRRLAPTLPVILMTAHLTPEVADEALKLGAFRVITKPFELGELAPLLESALAPSHPC